MSLLMDALRKAEEAKKKAEQGDSASESQQAEEPQAASTKAPVASEPEIPSPETESANRPIPDVAIEFEPEQEAVDSSEAGESPASSETTNDSLRLEPIDSSLSQATRQPIETDVTPDYSAETRHQAAEDSGSGKTNEVEVEIPSQQLEPIEKAPPPAVPDNSANIESARPEEKIEAPSAEPQRQYKPADPDPVQESPVTEKPEGSAEEKPKIALAGKRSPISERTQADRRGAQTLFDAKLQGKKRSSIRIRRSTKIWIAQITIGLMLMIGAYFYFFVINTATDSFNVPEQYLTNQAQFSENFNQSLTQTEIPATVPLDDPLSVELAAEELDIEFPEQPTDDSITVPGPADESIIAPEPAPAIDVTVVGQQPELETTIAEAPEQIVETASVENEPQAETQQEQATAVTEPEELAVNEVATAPAPLVSSQGSTNSISFSRTDSPSSIDPILRDAYSAFQRDNLLVARDLYQQVLANSPRNRDALLGMAAIASRDGQSSLAMEYYSRLLARDPSDAVARAGLLGLRPLGGPEQQERELRRLLELHPNVAPVAYALGNFYARQNRWNDAQRYYFDALQQAKINGLQGLPVNPDYAFNLAVSLEHLNQGPAAETYYREAIAYSAEFPASFEVSIARDRLLSLAEVDTQ